jgi:hypothetical protein
MGLLDVQNGIPPVPEASQRFQGEKEFVPVPEALIHILLGSARCEVLLKGKDFGFNPETFGQDLGEVVAPHPRMRVFPPADPDEKKPFPWGHGEFLQSVESVPDIPPILYVARTAGNGRAIEVFVVRS